MRTESNPDTAIRAVRLVASREISTRIRSKAFKWTTAVNLVIVIGFLVVLKLAGGSDSTEKVGFTAPAQPLAGPLASVAKAVGTDVTTSTVDEAAGMAQVRDGGLDALVVGSPDSFRVVVKQDLPGSLSDAFAVLARQLTLNQQIVQAGGDPAAVAAAVDAARVEVQTLEPAREYEGVRITLAIITGVLVYTAIMLYGQLVAQGVVEEKSSRIVEILLTTIRPWQLMLGKVLGIGLIGMLQMGVTTVAGLGAGLALDAFDFPTGIAAGAAIWMVVWFVLGYLVYALLFASLGALVSRQEDVGGATAPALIALILPYLLAVTVLPADPDNRLMAIASQLPFFAPLIMPMRIALDAAPVWQIAVSLVLTVALIGALVWFAGRVYRNAVLHMGSKVKLRDALRAG